MSIALRNAAPSDAKLLAELAERTFRETFGAVNTVEDMALHCRTTYSEAIQAAEIADPARQTLLVETQGRLAAYAQLRWGKSPDCVKAKLPGEIQRLYVASDWHGKGIAPQLMNACLAALQRRGCDAAWLGVWERNPRAIAFYRKAGFVEVGDHTFVLGSDAQRDIIMLRSGL